MFNHLNNSDIRLLKSNLMEMAVQKRALYTYSSALTLSILSSHGTFSVVNFLLCALIVRGWCSWPFYSNHSFMIVLFKGQCRAAVHGIG